MRIVNSLDDTLKCPNCGTLDLHWRKNNMGRDYLFCSDCHEEIFENEMTCSAESTIKEKEKENFVFEMREEISALDWCSYDAKTQILVENLKSILNKIIDYIEEN